MDLPLAGIPDLTFQITCPIDKDVTGSAQDFGRRVWRTQSSPVDVRVKKLFKSNSGCRDTLDDAVVAQELEQWHKVRHPNVVSVFGIFHRDLTPFLVTLWITGGNLNVFLTQHHQFLSSVDRMSLIRDVAAGLHCLHTFSIVHGNLIGANILIDNGRTACITDFGLASVRGPIQGSAFLGTSSDAPGAIRWAATELITKDVEPERPTIHSDIYSFGSVVLQIATGKVPWSELEDEFYVCVKLSQGLVPLKPEDCRIKDSLWAFIQRCWEFVPKDRPTSINALDFAEIEFRATLSMRTVKALIDDSPVVASREMYPATQPSQGASSAVSARSSALENHPPSILSSPEPSRVVPSVDSRRSSVLGQGVSVRDGVTVPWNNVGSGRPGSVAFVDDASAPLYSSPVSTPAVKTEVIKSFGIIPATPSNHANGNRNSMGGASTATGKSTTRPSSQSAWAKGPPQRNSSSSSSSAPSPRSQSPASPHAAIAISHSRRPSALGQGVTVPRNNAGFGRRGSVIFGSIDDASAPLSSSSASTPAVKTEVIKSFGTVPATSSKHVNGKTTPPTPSNSSTTTSNPATSTASTPKPIINKAYIAKLFSSSSSQPSSNTSSPSRPSNLPPHHQPSSSTSQPPPQPSQLGAHSYTPFVPGARSLQQGATPRSPAFPRAMPSVPNQSRGPQPIPASPRIASHPHQALPTSAPQVPMQPMQWGGYYYPMDPYNQPQHPWYYTMPSPLTHQQPHQPGPLSVSPHPAAPPLPDAPTMAYTAPHSPHTPQPPPSSPFPPHAPSTSNAPRLNTNASAPVPGGRPSTNAIIKSQDVTEVTLDT